MVAKGLNEGFGEVKKVPERYLIIINDDTLKIQAIGFTFL